MTPSTAAAQAASGTSVANADAAAATRADRQAADGESTLLLPAPVADASKTEPVWALHSLGQMHHAHKSHVKLFDWQH